MLCPHCGSPLLAGARFCGQCGNSASADLTRVVIASDQLREQLAQATADEYLIQSELGRGGMAAVFLAEDLTLGRRVAIKVMIPGFDATEGMADRFLLEARTAAQLSHPNIIPIHAVRTTGQLRYFVMKFIPGRSLDRVIASRGPLPPPVVQSILAQVGSALEHAHLRGVVHRDIKPANIMLDEDGTAIVTDFGIAKVATAVSLTQAGSTVGTPTYMSPEQCSGKPVTGASDQYALGCVGFELIAGRPPFTQLDVLPVLLAHVSDPPPRVVDLRPDCPTELACAIDRMLAKSPAARWPSVGDAVLAARAAAQAFDPAVRAALRALASDGTTDLPRMASTPLSPLPDVRTVMITPWPTQTPPTGAGSGMRASGPESQVPGVAQVGGEVLTVAIEPNGAFLQAGAGMQFRARPRDRSGLPVPNVPVTWRSSAPDIVTVSDGGIAVAQREGEADITALTGAARASVRIRVARVPVALLRVAPTEPWQVGEHRGLEAVALDQSGAVLPARRFTWQALDPGIATVDHEGVVHGIAPGRARFELRCEGQATEAVVEVRPATGRLTIVPGEGALAVGQVARLVATLHEADGTLGPTSGATWSSSDLTVLRVAGDGEVTAFLPGMVRIRAAYEGQVAEVSFLVTRVDVADMRITSRVTTVGAGERVRLVAQATDRLGSVLTGRIITWVSSHPEIATVAPDGTVCGISPGTARITASIGAGAASVEIRVPPVSVSGLRLEPASLTLRLGESARVRAVAQNLPGGIPAGVPVEWQSSDPLIAAVSRDGVVSGLRFGAARIAATAGGKRATLAVEVRASTTISAQRPRVGY